MRQSLSIMLALPAVAAAQTVSAAIPSRLNPRDPAVIYGEDLGSAEQAVTQFGICTLNRDRNEVQALLDLPVDSRRYDSRLRGVVSEDCLAEGSIVIPPEILRGSLFEALYLEKYRRFDPPLAQVRYDYAAGYNKPLSKSAAAALSLVSVGDCVVRAQPAASRNFILNASTTAVGSRALALIISALPPCVFQGHQVHFSRPIVRAAVAEALYRLTSQAAKAGMQ